MSKPEVTGIGDVALLEAYRQECEVQLSPQEWAEFQRMLTQPPKTIPEITRLLRERRK